VSCQISLPIFSWPRGRPPMFVNSRHGGNGPLTDRVALKRRGVTRPAELWPVRTSSLKPGMAGALTVWRSPRRSNRLNPCNTVSHLTSLSVFSWLLHPCAASVPRHGCEGNRSRSPMAVRLRRQWIDCSLRPSVQVRTALPSLRMMEAGKNSNGYNGGAVSPW